MEQRALVLEIICEDRGADGKPTDPAKQIMLQTIYTKQIVLV